MWCGLDKYSTEKQALAGVSARFRPAMRASARLSQLNLPKTNRMHSPTILVRAVTRESVPDTLNARMTSLIEYGERERTVGFAIEGELSRVMNRGNPPMVNKTRELLSGRGRTISRRSAPGHLAVENYR